MSEWDNFVESVDAVCFESEGGEEFLLWVHHLFLMYTPHNCTGGGWGDSARVWWRRESGWFLFYYLIT